MVMNATTEDLVKKLNSQFDAIQSLTTKVKVVASTGGAQTGKINEKGPFDGFIIIQKPRNLRVILQVPWLGSEGMDMVSDGHDFKLVNLIQKQAKIGKDEVVKPSENLLENLRPGVFFDSMLIQSLQPGESAALTESSRILEMDVHKHEAFEEPDYDLTILRNKSGNIDDVLRVVHFNRVTLLPYRQDIYDERGRLTTTVTYDGYQKFTYTDKDEKAGEVQFPTAINIDRPLDQYSLKVTITKLTPNQAMEPDQFELCIPAGFKVQNMDDPGSPPTIAQSDPCEPQSPH
jgi:outer membrane lipoprotein-sorting protein